MMRNLLLATLVLVAGSAMAQQRFIIERDIPGASKMTPEQLRDAARTSNKVLHDMGPDIQWVQSFVAGDKIYCVYNAPDEALVRKHAQLGGFPADQVSAVRRVIDPTTAEA